MADNKENLKPGDNPGNIPGKGKGGRPKISIYWLYALIAISFFASQYFFKFGQHPKEIEWPKLISEIINPGDAEKIVVVNNEIAEVYIKKDSLNLSKFKDLFSDNWRSVSKTGPHYVSNIPSIDAFVSKMDEAKFTHYEIIKRKDFGDWIGWLLPFLILGAIWLFIFRRMSGNMGGGAGGAGNIFNVGKSKAILFDKDTQSRIDFKDVAGLEEAKVEIKEIVDFLKNPKKYTDLGGKIPKGALLIGPPGTGKTLLAKAVAGEANVPFFSMSGSEFVEMFVGVGASRVRDLFRQAKEKAPCIVFIDEIDAIGRARGKNANFGANDERENTLNQLLTEMDGFGTNSGVIILAATNRADILDRALIRAGRFDRQIHVELPDLNERKEIFKVHLRPVKLDTTVDVDFLAKQTPGFSGADIANVCNESALIAARKDKPAVQKQDFLDAVDRIIGGLERKNRIISALEKKTIAYHEAGHATVSWLLEHANPLLKVTIIPRGRALGAAWYLPEERQLSTKQQMLDEMCSALGGRASEKLIFEKVSTGALNDLERVTKQAYAMVSYFGMSDAVGHISFYDSSGQNEYAFSKPYSEKTANLIDEESKMIVSEQFQRAIDVLTENREGLTRLAEQLLEKEVIFSEDLEIIFGKRKSANAEEQKLLIKANGVGATEKPEAEAPNEPQVAEESKSEEPGNQLA